ncbi:MAG: prolipoprotein diacylglyceryl transferase [Clostridiales bacterium]|nr:prolipoprotein diacylglyceryl transferase [Clostridiales bacterium]
MSYNISEISFPGLGIGPFEINNTAFTLFGRDVKWYGVIICIGILAGFAYFAYRATQSGIILDTVLDITLVTVPSAIIGARLYFIVFYGADSFMDAIAIWNGGLAIYGGIIFGALAVIIMCKIKKVKFFAFADMIAPGVMLGQLIGRWGNFCNGEAFGAETDIFCRMGLCNVHTGFAQVFVHPTFLYESLWNLIGFTLINVFYKKKKFNGEIFFWYAAWYGLGRTFIEMLRQDSLYFGKIRVSSLLGFICFALITPLVIVLHVLYNKKAARGEIENGAPCDITALFVNAKVKAADGVFEAVEIADENEVPDDPEDGEDGFFDDADVSGDVPDEDTPNEIFEEAIEDRPDYDTVELKVKTDESEGDDSDN